MLSCNCPMFWVKSSFHRISFVFLSHLCVFLSVCVIRCVSCLNLLRGNRITAAAHLSLASFLFFLICQYIYIIYIYIYIDNIYNISALKTDPDYLLS